MIHASNYLDIDVLLTASCKAAARALMRYRTSPTAGSNAVRDYMKLTTATTTGESLAGISNLDVAVYRVCLVPECCDQVSLEQSKLENRSLKQQWMRLRGRTEWNRPMSREQLPTNNAVTSPPTETWFGGSRRRHCLTKKIYGYRLSCNNFV